MALVLEHAFKEVVEGDATLSGLLGANFHALLVPENASFPAVTFQRIDGQSEATTDGLSNLRRSGIQFDCYAEKYGDACGLANAVRDLFDNKRHEVVGGEIFGDLQAQRDDYDREREEKGKRLYRISLDFDFWERTI